MNEELANQIIAILAAEEQAAVDKIKALVVPPSTAVDVAGALALLQQAIAKLTVA